MEGKGRTKVQILVLVVAPMKDFDFRQSHPARWPRNSYLSTMQSRNWIAKTPSGRLFLHGWSGHY